MAHDRCQQLRHMLEHEPGNTFLRYALALEYHKANETGQAIDLLEAIRGDAPQYLPLYYQLGRMYVAQQQLEKALAIYQAGKAVAHAQSETKTLNELEAAHEDVQDLREDMD